LNTHKLPGVYHIISIHIFRYRFLHRKIYTLKYAKQIYTLHKNPVIRHCQNVYSSFKVWLHWSFYFFMGVLLLMSFQSSHALLRMFCSCHIVYFKALEWLRLRNAFWLLKQALQWLYTAIGGTKGHADMKISEGEIENRKMQCVIVRRIFHYEVVSFYAKIVRNLQEHSLNLQADSN
jgi:hypothetical protein